jgi:hypothetical protein
MKTYGNDTPLQTRRGTCLLRRRRRLLLLLFLLLLLLLLLFLLLHGLHLLWWEIIHLELPKGVLVVGLEVLQGPGVDVVALGLVVVVVVVPVAVVLLSWLGWGFSAGGG